MRNGFGAGNGNGEIRAKIAADKRTSDRRIADARAAVRSGTKTLEQAYRELDGR